jgi:hypothetical protein
MKINNHMLLTATLFAIPVFTYSMHESIRKQIKDAEREFASSEPWGEWFSNERMDQQAEHNTRIATIVLDAGDLVTNQVKLHYLVSDRYYADRKEIVKVMIEREKVKPNVIDTNGNTPLYESVAFEDIEFTKYLLLAGARMDKKTHERAQQSSHPSFKALAKHTRPVQ